MRKKICFLLFVICSFAAYCLHGAFSYDNRSAGNLSAYCNIDFRGVTDPQTKMLSSATLSIVDFRYASAPLESFLVLDIDGQEYRLENVAVSALPPSYALHDKPGQKTFQHANSLFVSFPPQLLKAIADAQTLKVSFKYQDKADPVKLPLSAVDLDYWKKQLPGANAL